MNDQAIIEAVQGLNEKLDKLMADIRREASPWLTAEDAAFHVSCSLSQVYLLRNKGLFKEFAVPGTSLVRFHRKQIDEAMMKAEMPKIRRGRKPESTISRRPPADDGSSNQPESPN